MDRVLRETFEIDGHKFWLILDPCPGQPWTRFYLCGEDKFTHTGRADGPICEARAVARRAAIRRVRDLIRGAA